MSNPNALAIQRPSLGLLCTEPFRAASEFAQHKFGKSYEETPRNGHPVVIFSAWTPMEKPWRPCARAVAHWAMTRSTGARASIPGRKAISTPGCAPCNHNTYDLDLQPGEWCGRVADLSPSQAVPTRE